VADKRVVLDEILSSYRDLEETIRGRLEDFKQVWQNGTDRDLFNEMAFCLLTPQSKARSCWKAITFLQQDDLLYKASQEELAIVLRKYTRFHNNKADNVVRARRRFLEDSSIRKEFEEFSNEVELRDWLVKNVRGYGPKEASHFLRNIGKGENLAILDRHILRNLVLLGVIRDIPKSMGRAKYNEIEQAMRKFCEKNKIGMAELDLVLWARQTGEVFK
jgi:N-glycosylase/DNA lyase